MFQIVPRTLKTIEEQYFHKNGLGKRMFYFNVFSYLKINILCTFYE